MTTTTPAWILQVQQHLALTAAAQALGYTARGTSIVGCPGCGERGHGSSKIIRRQGQPEFWFCHRCHAGGDAVDFAAYHQFSGKARGREQHDQLQVLFASLVPQVDYPETTPTAQRLPPRRSPPPPPAAPPTGLRPDAAELAALWAASAAVTEDGPVADYLRHRGMDPEAVAALGVARALPEDYPWPSWWPHPQSPKFKGQRLGVLLYESDGRVATLQARSIEPGCPKPDRQKWPRAGTGSASGVFFANAHGQQMLRGEVSKADIDGALFVEGLTDAIRASLVVAAGTDRLAVIGAANGSFEILSEIPVPEGVALYAATDEGDLKKTGERYAQLVGRAFGADRVYRMLPSDVLGEPEDGVIYDLDDALREDGVNRLRQLTQAARRRGPMRGAWECADPEVGMVELTQATARALKADSAGGAKIAIVGLMRDDEAMRGLGAAWRTRNSEVEASLLELRDAQGCGPHVTRLRSTITATAQALADQEVTEKRKRLRLAVVGDTPPTLAEALADVLTGWTLPAGLTVPDGWEVKPDGIYEKKFSREGGYESYRRIGLPVIVTGRLTDTQTGSTNLRLEWPRQGRWISAVLSQADATNARSLQLLGDQQAPIHSGNAAIAARWISELEIENDRTLPRALTSSRMGWHGQKGFLWGSHHLRPGEAGEARLVDEMRPDSWDPDHLHLLAEGKDADLAGGYTASGDYRTWARGLEDILEGYPTVWIAIYAALAAPLLKGLKNAPAFIVSLEGDSGGGKSTALAAACSCWGNPAEGTPGPMVSWDNSATRIEEITTLLSHMPLILDDTKQCGEDPTLISKVIFMIVGQQGRGRSSNYGGAKTAKAFWKTILITSSETPLTAINQDGGSRARVLPLRGRPFGDIPREGKQDAEAALDVVSRNYGHAGPRLIRWILDNEGSGARIRASYARYLVEYEERAAYDNTAGRASKYLAVLRVAQELAHDPEVLGLRRPRIDPIETVAWPAVSIAAQEADRPKVALSLAWSWINTNDHRFWGRHPIEKDGTPRPTGQGWLGVWKAEEEWDRIAVEPSHLDAFLKSQGFRSPMEVLTAWRRRGWLLVNQNKPGLKYPATTASGGRSPHYIIQRQAIDALGGDE